MMVILLSLLVAGLLAQTPFVEQITVGDAQRIFNQQFCRPAIKETFCQAAFKNISDLTPNIHFNQNTISQNAYGIKTIVAQTFVSSSTYYNFSFPVSAPTQTMMYRPLETEQKGIKGVILYFHSTIFGRRNGPSSNSNYWRTLGNFYASQNYVVLIPNFLGFGDIQPQKVQPFMLYPKQIINATINILNSISKNISQWYNQEEFSLDTIGFAEGASYSIWFNKCFFTPADSCSELEPFFDILSRRYRVKRSVGLEGAYDLSGVQFPFWTTEVSADSFWNEYRIRDQMETNVGKPGLAVLLALSYLTYSGGKSPSQLKDYFADGFFEMKKAINYDQLPCTINYEQYDLYSAINSHVAAPQLQISIAIACAALNKTLFAYDPYNLSKIYLGPKMEDMETGIRNTILSVIKIKELERMGLKEAISAASIVDYGKKTKNPLFIFTLEKDSIISPLNSVNFLKEKSEKVDNMVFKNSNYQTFGQSQPPTEVDHLRAELIANIFALNYLEA